MARALSDIATQYLMRPAAVVAGPPLTLALHFYINDAANSPYLIGLGSTADSYNYLTLRNMTGRKIQIQARSRAVPGDATGVTANAWSAGAWQHLCGIFASTASRTAILNGDVAGKGVSTVAIDPPGLDRTSVGALVRASPVGFVNGRVAEVAVWNAALTEAEAVALAKGIAPTAIRPANLVAYWPLGGRFGPLDADRWKSALNLTPMNGPGWAEHCPVRYRRSASLGMGEKTFNPAWIPGNVLLGGGTP